MWVCRVAWNVPCSATERLRAPADSVRAGRDIDKTCFDPGRG